MEKKTKFEMAAELFGERLDSTIFTWQSWCCNVGVSTLRIFDGGDGHSQNDDKIFNKRFICEGWCDGGSLIVRPRTQGIAIMVWDKELEEKVWCHVSDDFLDTLYVGYILINKE